MTPRPPKRSPLGRAMQARRSELDHMTIKEAAALAGISPTTWTNVELGRPHRVGPHVERALGWRPGSAEAAAAGGDPMLDPVFEARRAAERAEAESARSRESVVIVDLSEPGSPVVVLAAGGQGGVSETTRRALLAQAQKALEAARRTTGPEGRLRLTRG